VGGFEEMLRAINDPEHEEHESYLTWLGGTFDPAAFNLEETNQRLRRLWRRASLDSRG
jgi:hypothetical protein